MSKCTVKMDGQKFESNDFVAVLAQEDGTPKLLYNTDAITLGMAIQMTAVAYKEALDNLSEEDRQMVKETLFIGDLRDE